MRREHRRFAGAAAAVGATTVVTIAVITVVTGGDEVGAVLLAGGLLVAGHTLRHRARNALIYRSLRERRPTGVRFGDAGEVPRGTHAEETS
jgi:hypothetical protein